MGLNPKLDSRKPSCDTTASAVPEIFLHSEFQVLFHLV